MGWDYNFVIAVDFDGTIYNRDTETVNEEVLSLSKQSKQLGCILILWTSRCKSELQEAIDICSSRGLYFDYINEYPKRTLSPKICADLYIDNKAMHNDKIPVRKYCRHI